MPSENKLKKLIEVIKSLPSTAKNAALDTIGETLSAGKKRFGQVFSRQNLLNSLLPQPLAMGANKLMDFFKSDDVVATPNGATPGQSNNRPEDEIADEESDLDVLELIVESLEDGFIETNENLVKIMDKLAGSASASNTESTSKLLSIAYSGSTQEESTNELIQVAQLSHESTESTQDSILELIDINGKTIQVLEKIEKNTKVDELKAREDEIERRKQKLNEQFSKAGFGEGDKGGDGKKGGILSSLLSSATDAVLGYLGINAAKGALTGKLKDGIKGAASSSLKFAKNVGGKVVNAAETGLYKATDKAKSFVAESGGLKNAAGAVWDKTKAFASNTASSTTRVLDSITPASSTIDKAKGALGSVWDKTKGVASGAFNTMGKAADALSPSVKNGLQGAKAVGGKLLGAPLAVGLGGYEAYNVSKDEKLTKDEKAVEYSKIGGKTAGTLAGAKLGVMLGAPGGPIGMAIGGILGGVGGYFLGEKGGEVISNAVVGSAPKTDSVKSATETAVSKSSAPNTNAASSATSTFSEFDFSQNDSVNYQKFADFKNEREASLLKEYIGSRDVSKIPASEMSYFKSMAKTKAKEEAIKKFSKEISASSNVKVRQSVSSLESVNSQKAAATPTTKDINVANMVKPDIGTIQPGQTKTNNLQNLTQQMESTNAEKENLATTNNAAPVVINNTNNSSSGGNSSAPSTKMVIPGVRNQDGTLQRLLDANYRPLIA